MKQIVIHASLTDAQISYLKDLAERESISATFFLPEGEESSHIEEIRTPISNQLIADIADNLRISLIEAAQKAEEFSSVEDAIRRGKFPSKVMEILESYL